MSFMIGNEIYMKSNIIEIILFEVKQKKKMKKKFKSSVLEIRQLQFIE